MEDQEWAVLQTLKDQASLGNQRDIAQSAGLSLGLTNAVLKKLIKKGFLIAKRINGRNLSYVMTPTGLEAVARRSYRFVRRTLKNVSHYREALQLLVSQTPGEVHLVGNSDLDFLVEYSCLKAGKAFTRGDEVKEGVLNLLSEDEEPREDFPGVWLRNLLSSSEAPGLFKS